MRNGWIVLFVAGLVVSSLSAAEGKSPNVLVMVADDLGFADVGFNGGKVIATPNLDRLAGTGVRLTNFRVAPVCSPTRAGLLTGKWPLRFGIMRAVVPPWSKHGLPPEETTLAEALGDAGYERRGVIGKWHLGHARREFLPLNQGFTHFYGHYNGAIDYFTHEREGEADWHRNEKTVREEGYSTDLVGGEAERFVREAPAGKPWFLYVAFNAPHSPFQAKAEDLKKYSNLPRREQVYAAMVDCMDQAVGRVLAAVEARSDAENTLILFTSDNGGARGSSSNNGLWRGDKATVYEGGTRAAAAIRWPKAGLAGGRKFDGRIGYIDVMPTVLSAVGKPVPKGVDGMDALPALRGETELPERPWFSYIHQGPNAQASVHKGKWKLVGHGDFFAEDPGSGARFELYDLEKDAAEEKDVAAANPQVVSELRLLLREFGSWQKAGVGAFEEGRAGFKAPKDWVVE